MIPLQLQKEEFRFCIIPRKKKRPIEKAWTTTANYKFNDPRLLLHIKQGGNYGVVTGFGNLAVLDCDNEDFVKAAINELPQTFTVKTGGGGSHLYFICTDLKEKIVFQKNKGKNHFGELQSYGEQVVGPNSTHENGNKYSILLDIEIANIPYLDIKKRLVKFLDLNEKESKTESESWKKFKKNLSITKVLTFYGHTPNVKGFWTCPFHNDIYPNDFWINEDQWGYCFSSTCKQYGDMINIIREKEKCNFYSAIRKAGEICGVEIPIEFTVKESTEDIMQLFYESKTTKKGTYKLVQYILNEWKIITLTDNDEVYYYEMGIYRQAEKKILEQCQQIIGSYATIHILNEVLGHIKRMTYTDRKKCEAPKELVCVDNGIYNLNEGYMRSHTPELIFFNKLPVKYDSEVQCPIISKFLGEVVNKEDMPILQEFIGYLLLRDLPFHKSLILVGSGANGKSTFIRLIKAFLGQENCAAISLQSIEFKQFAISSLHGKLANLFADLPRKGLSEASNFKVLTGGDAISAEKKFKDPFEFTNYSKMIFSANQIPRVDDDTDAFFRRWAIVSFQNQFLGGNADPLLNKKMETEEELSGFFNFAIIGLRRLLTQSKFSETMSLEETRIRYTRLSDSVASFCLDNVESNPEGIVIKKELYNSYTQYCREKKCTISSEEGFFRRIIKIMPVEDCRITFDDERKRCFKGIKINKVDTKDPQNKLNWTPYP